MTSTPQRITQAIHEIQSGEEIERNYFLLAEYCEPLLMRYFRRQGVPKDFCEDLTQEVLNRVSINLKEFRGQAPFEAWLFKIAKHVSLDHWKGENTLKRKAQLVSLDGDGRNVEGPEPRIDPPDPALDSNQLNALIDQEQAQRLKDEVDRLPKQMSRCMQLRIDQELSNEKIAEVLQISVETVKSHLAQARKKLAAAISAVKQGQTGLNKKNA
jgi:RNA polymerase sigma-70 factor, ECF subfamily